MGVTAATAGMGVMAGMVAMEMVIRTTAVMRGMGTAIQMDMPVTAIRATEMDIRPSTTRINRFVPIRFTDSRSTAIRVIPVPCRFMPHRLQGCRPTPDLMAEKSCCSARPPTIVKLSIPLTAWLTR